MLVSLEWLKEYVDLPADLAPEQIMHDLTLATVEVEGVVFTGRALERVCVAEVLQADKVPDTKLTLTACDAGEHGVLSVVCGAANVRAGMRVALALPGALIYPKGAAEAIEVREAEVRGLASQAVICAAGEIGLSAVFPPADDQSIMELHELSGVAVGTPLAQAIGFDDAVFEIDNKSLTNRPDLWGHYGIARELAAIYDAPLGELPRAPEVAASDTLLAPSDASLCNRFTATVFEGVLVSDAPLAMRSRLARVGQRSIDLFVDLTNYVMFACGQPSHAYDADELTLPLCARASRDSESVTLLDGSEVSAHPSVPFIADAQRPLAVAGVMGGEASGVTPASRRIFLEMANFDARLVRAASQHTGARTEASSRFEKALDTQRIDAGLGLFHHLLADIQPAAKAVAFQDALTVHTTPAEVQVEHSYITSRLGVDFPVARITRYLEALGFAVREQAGVFSLAAPTWRSTGDVSLPADIVEEVARLHGYDNFRFVPPRVALTHLPRARRVPLDRQVRELLAGAGLQEVFTYPWTKRALLQAAADSWAQFMTLEMPPAPDQERLRPVLLPNLLEAVDTNLRYFDDFGLFEVGAVYPGAGEGVAAAAVLVGDDADYLFRRMRGMVEHVIRGAQLTDMDLRPSSQPHDWADPSVRLDILSGGEVIGVVGRVSNRSKRLAGIDRAEVIAFECRLEALQFLPTRENRYERVAEFPTSWFDVSVLVDDSVPWAQVYSALAGMDALLRDVRWVGEYRGEGVPDGARSLTLRVVVGAEDRTLVSEEVDALRVRVLETLEKIVGARQR